MAKTALSDYNNLQKYGRVQRSADCGEFQFVQIDINPAFYLRYGG